MQKEKIMAFTLVMRKQLPLNSSGVDREREWMQAGMVKRSHDLSDEAMNLRSIHLVVQ